MSNYCTRSAHNDKVDNCRVPFIRLVIVLHDNPADYVLLVAVDHLLMRNRAVATSPALAPLFHRRCVCVVEAQLDALFLQDGALPVRGEEHTVVRQGEVEQTEARVAPLILWWLDDTVYRCLVVSTGEEFHRVTGIDNLAPYCVKSS